MIKIEPLYYLFCVSKYNSLSKTAEHLHVTPSTISISIKNLETALNLPLLSRNSKGVTLTSEGEFIVTKVKDILFLMQDIEDFAKEYQKNNIPSYPNFNYLYFFSELSLFDALIEKISTKIYQFTQDFDLILCDEPLRTTLATLNSEQNSAALLLLGEKQISSIVTSSAYKDIYIKNLKSYPIGILFNKNTRLLTNKQLKQDTVSIEDLQNLPIIRPNWNTSFQHVCDDMLLSNDLAQFSYKTLAPNLTSYRSFLKNDIGIGLGIFHVILGDSFSKFTSFKPLNTRALLSLCFLCNKNLSKEIQIFLCKTISEVYTLTYKE